MKFKFCIIIALLIFNQSCEKQSSHKRKIKLKADFANIIEKDNVEKTILKLDAIEKRSIAILTFENQTGNRNLDWLSQGIADMLIRDLSQSHYLNVITLQRLLDILNSLKVQSPETVSYNILSKIGEQARAEVVIKGSFSKGKDSLIITAELFDLNSGKLLKQNQVAGFGLEDVFSMVDDLSNRVKSSLKLSFEETDDLKIADITTNSLEAYQHYAKGIELVYRLYFGDAIKKFERAVDYDSSFAMAHLWSSIVYRRLGKVNEAKQSIAKAIKYSKHATSKEKMKIEWVNAKYREDYDNAFDLLEKLVQEFPDDKELHYQLSGNYYYRQEIEKAQQHIDRVFELDPNFIMAYVLQSIIYQHKAEYDSAVFCLKKAIEISPNDATPYNNLAKIYESQGEFRKAEKYYEKALAIKPDFYNSSLNLAQIYSSSGKYDKATLKYLSTLKILPSEELKSMVYAGLANIDVAQGKYNDAIEHIKQAQQFLTSEESKANYDIMLAGIYLKKEMNDSTRDITKRILAVDKDNFYASNILVDAFLKQGEIDSAKLYAEILNRFIEKSKLEIFRNLHNQMMGKISAAQGEFEKAIDYYEKILALNPEAISIYEKIGKLYLDRNQALKAIEYYKRFLDKNPCDALAKYHLALAYDLNGNEKKAKKIMSEFLKLWENADPNIRELKKARQYLVSHINN